MNSDSVVLNLVRVSAEPLYAQIVRQIRGQILSGNLLPGVLVPSIRDLASDHQISVITVQKAYEELVRDGVLCAHRGKGFFVAEITPAESRRIGRERIETSAATFIRSAIEEGASPKEIGQIFSEVLQKEMRKKQKGS